MKEFIKNKVSLSEVMVMLAIVGLLATAHLPR